MEYILNNLNEKIAKKIFGNKSNAIIFLTRLFDESNSPYEKTIMDKMKSSEIWKLIIKHWNYQKALPIIREIFKESKKFQNGLESEKAIDKLLEEWTTLKLGEVEWPCSQGDFDGFVQRINALSESGIIKDEKVKIAAVKYRRLKELNTVRNDFIETLIFLKNEEILPTINHSRGTDFYIRGISYDQKVAKSPTNQFKAKFGQNWRDEAINNPSLVAQYLYEYQDEGRFGSDPRLFIVYLDENIPIFKIKEQIKQLNLEKPLEITFEYKHKNVGLKAYKTTCYVILLSK